MGYVRSFNLRRFYLRQLVRRALKEDIGRRDITTELFIPKDKIVRAALLAKEDFLLCGLEVVERVFREIDKNIKFNPLVRDGQSVRKGVSFVHIEGRAQSILTAERVALNFLSLLSGVATKTRQYVDAVKPFKVKILDTRKTIPGLRELQKYAVRVGGGVNHRFRLDEMVLIKDNHLKVHGSRFMVQGSIRKKIPKETKIEIEVNNLREFKEALRAEPDIIMLDNMKIPDIRKAIKIKRNTQYAIRNTLIEASGGITLANVKKVAATGVDMISIGELTHSLKSMDISLEVI